MRRHRYWAKVLSFLAASALSGLGQSLPDRQANIGLPTPPDSGIQDQNGFFSRDSGAMKRISSQVRILEENHGFRILLLVEPVLIGTSAPELAAQLQQSWLAEGHGLVVVFESDSRNLGFGRDTGGEPVSDESTRRVPPHETVGILMRAREATATNLAPEAYVEALMENLVNEFDHYFKLRKAPLPKGRSMRLGLLTVGGLALLALAAIGIGALVRLPSMAGKRSFRFPAVDRPERLGAPGGGGNVTVRRFRSK
jgi:hypothetical protein